MRMKCGLFSNLISDGGASPALFLAQLICWLVAGLLPVYAVFAWRDLYALAFYRRDWAGNSNGFSATSCRFYPIFV